MTGNPWLCDQLGVDWREWSRTLLDGHGYTDATLHLVGSAATGFSLSPEKAGRPFRRLGGVGAPSDLDIALIDGDLFRSCWNEMVSWERSSGGASYLLGHDRERVYWGRIDDHRVQNRSAVRIKVRMLIDACRRSSEFRGYPASLRVYRRQEDLVHYVVRGLQALGRTVR